MPKIPRVLGPSVQQGAAPRPQLSGAEQVGQGLSSVAQGLDAVGDFFQREHQRAQERELTAARLDAEQRFTTDELGGEVAGLGDAIGMVGVNPSKGKPMSVQGWSNIGGEDAKGLVDGNDSYDGVLNLYDKHVDEITSKISSPLVAEKFRNWAESNRLQVEIRARKHEDTEGVKDLRDKTSVQEQRTHDKLVGMAAEPRLQGDTILREVQVLEDLWRAGDRGDDWIENEKEQFLSGVRTDSINSLLVGKQYGTAREYFDNYGHQITDNVERKKLRAEIDRGEKVQSVATEALRIFDIIRPKTGRIGAAERKVFNREYERILAEDAELANAVKAQFQVLVDQHNVVEDEYDQKTFLDGTRFIREHKTLDGFNYLRLTSEDKLRLETMAAKVRAANLNDPIDRKASFALRHAIEANPEFATDPFKLLMENADKLGTSDFEALYKAADEVKAGEVSIGIYNDKQRLMRFIRQVYEIDDDETDIDVTRKYGHIFDVLDDKTKQIPEERSSRRLTESEWADFHKEISSVGVFDRSWGWIPGVADETKVKLYDMTPEQLATARISDDRLIADFAPFGPVTTVVDGEIVEIPAIQGVRITAETLLNNSTNGEGEVTKEDIDRFLFDVIVEGSDPGALATITEAARNRKAVYPTKMEGMSNDEYYKKTEESMIEATKQSKKVAEATIASIKRVAALGGIKEEDVPSLDNLLLSMAKEGIISRDDAQNAGVRHKVYLDLMAERLVKSDGVGQAEAYRMLGLSDKDVQAILSMSSADQLSAARESEITYANLQIIADKAEQARIEAAEKAKGKEPDAPVVM